MPSKQPTPPPSRSGRRREAVILVAIAAPVLLVAVVAAVVLSGNQDSAGIAGGSAAPSPSGASTTPDDARLVYPDSPTKGPADAPVTLVEFLDPECESCRAAYPLVEQILSDYEGRIRYVVRYVPGHAISALAVAALEEAGKQGRYWEMLEILFERQPEWGEQQTPQTEAFVAYGAEIGLDVAALTAALEDPDLSKVERDAADAAAVEIRGTPTFFINGGRLNDLSENGLRTMIDAALAG